MGIFEFVWIYVDYPYGYPVKLIESYGKLNSGYNFQKISKEVIETFKEHSNIVKILKHYKKIDKNIQDILIIAKRELEKLKRRLVPFDSIRQYQGVIWCNEIFLSPDDWRYYVEPDVFEWYLKYMIVEKRDWNIRNLKKKLKELRKLRPELTNEIEKWENLLNKKKIVKLIVKK